MTETAALKTYSIGPHTVQDVITSAQSGGAYFCVIQHSPVGSEVPPHVHTREDEIVFLVEGTLDVFLDGKWIAGKPRDCFNFKRGIVHGFKNTGSMTAKTFWTITPGTSFETFFRAVAAMPPGPPDFDMLDKLHAAHGITMPRNPD
jgi:quercetin dioxygenase-like cupin family protein